MCVRMHVHVLGHLLGLFVVAGLGLSLDPTPQPQKSQLIQCGV